MDRVASDTHVLVLVFFDISGGVPEPAFAVIRQYLFISNKHMAVPANSNLNRITASGSTQWRRAGQRRGP